MYLQNSLQAHNAYDKIKIPKTVRNSKENRMAENKMTAKEKLERVKDFRLIDDVFFEVFAQDKEACQEILRAILEDDELIVTSVVVQSSERNLYGRSVRLDALCTMGDGTKCNIEVQRADNDDHFRRVRFNASSITVKNSEPGEYFEDILDLYMVYISENDFIGD